MRSQFLILFRQLLQVRTGRADARRQPSWAIFHNFEEDGLRKAVVAEVLGDAVDVVIQDKRQMPHARSLELRLASGATARILLDQGFGAWRAAEEVRYEFRAAPKQQAASIGKLPVIPAPPEADSRRGIPSGRLS
jgi:DEAD/DEAH box helicase domain-containing protein